MCEAGNDFGPSTQYGEARRNKNHDELDMLLFCAHPGSALIKCGHTHQKLGLAYKEFIQSAAVGFMQPLKSFLDGEMKSLSVGILLIADIEEDQCH